MIMSDHEMRHRCLDCPVPMISPFEDYRITPLQGVLSFGLGSYGYDLRVGYNFKVFDSPLKAHGLTIDPKRDDWHKGFTEYQNAQEIIIPGNSFGLAESLETLCIPRDVLAVCLGKSTLARCGLIVNVTPLEPEWRGKVTIEISNTTPLQARIHPGEGICQVLFLKADRVCERSYADKQGIYQSQTGLTMPKVRGPVADLPMMEILSNYDSVHLTCPCGAQIEGEGQPVENFIKTHKPHTNGKARETLTEDGARAGGTPGTVRIVNL